MEGSFVFYLDQIAYSQQEWLHSNSKRWDILITICLHIIINICLY